MTFSRRRILHLAGAAACAVGAAAGGCGARLSDTAGTPDRRPSRRRHARHLRALDRGIAVGTNGPALRGREPVRRQRQYRHRTGRARGARRLHAADGDRAQRHQCDAFPDLKFNFLHDTAPVAGIGGSPFVMVVNPSFPAKTVPEFIAYAKANPGKINVASTGTGNLTHMAAEMFKMMAGVDLLHVPYRGETAAQADLLTDRVQVMFDPIPSSLGYIRGGKLRALAVTALKPVDALPDLPTIAQFLPGYEVSGITGISAPEGYAGRNHRHAQQSHQRRSGRPQDQGAVRRTCQHGGDRHAGRFRQNPRRRNREVGQGD